jgi:hypothetical protein
MAVCLHFFEILSAPNCHYYLQRAVTPDPWQVQIFKKVRQTAITFLQMAVTPDWIGSIALWEHITAFFSRAKKPSEDINSRLFLVNMEGLKVKR